MSPSECAPHPIGQAAMNRVWEKLVNVTRYLRRVLVQPPPGCLPHILGYRDFHALRISELVLKPREIPLKRVDVKTIEKNQVGLALKNPND